VVHKLQSRKTQKTGLSCHIRWLILAGEGWFVSPRLSVANAMSASGDLKPNAILVMSLIGGFLSARS